jgi:hypothetical protein
MWSRRAAWIVVLLLLAGGIGFAVTRKPLVAPSDAATQRKARTKRIDALLDQIAAIDRGDGDAGKREVLVGELETLYREDAAA